MIPNPTNATRMPPSPSSRKTNQRFRIRYDRLDQGQARTREITNNQGYIAAIAAVTGPNPKSGPHLLVFI
jgi:hypothetical protein